MAAQHFTELLPRDLLDSAVDLRPHVGVSEVGWRRADALRVLSALAGSDWAVLGGDVLVARGPAWEHALDNWHVQARQGEARDAYVARSHAASREVIERYPTGAEFLFVLVCGRVMG